MGADQPFFADPTDSGEYRPGAAVMQTGADRRTTVSIPIEAGTYAIRGRLTTSSSKPVNMFEEASTGPRVYSKSFALTPGSYVLQLTFTQGGDAPVTKELSFTVR